MQRSFDECFPYVFPFLFVTMWVVVMRVISWMGWSRFAERYGAPERPPGTAFHVLAARLGVWTSYRNALRCIPTEYGIYFYPFFLFRPWHPPFLVPWRSVVKLERRKVFFRDRIQLEIVDEAGTIHALLPLKAEGAMLDGRAGGAHLRAAGEDWAALRS
ncbi:MAG TPA: hypothetical protein VGO11_26390 [Chthoniobacteraceae bacterium]|jgi:hypothetical protein|nr:hypothetical protein [Chthoniobacteraceae bacterium]